MITKKISGEKEKEIKAVLKSVFYAMDEKGYEPIEQLIGYLLSEDPIYVTTYKNARKQITSVDCEDIRRNLLESYFGV